VEHSFTAHDAECTVLSMMCLGGIGGGGGQSKSATVDVCFHVIFILKLVL